MILISAWSRNLPEGGPSPKNYPHWPEVVDGLLKANHEVTQLACKGEPDIPGAVRMNDLPLDKIAAMMRSCSTWISVDNFFHHMAWTLGESGVVIFGSSDPEIFGHPENINILKDRHFLRNRQFGLWSQETPNPGRFIGPSAVLEAVRLSIRRRKDSRASLKA